MTRSTRFVAVLAAALLLAACATRPANPPLEHVDPTKVFEYLNDLPTSFVLPSEAVDRLRAAAAKILIADPEFRRLLKDVGARIVGDPR